MTDRHPIPTDGQPVSMRAPRPPRPREAALLRVFVDPAMPDRGGNPVPLVLDASGMTAADMQALAARHGHESVFVLAAEGEAGHDWRFRFFVPAHEMEMCGHATVGALWALRQWGYWTGGHARIQTLSGSVDAEWDAGRGWAWVSQPAAAIVPLAHDRCEAIYRVLRVDPGTPGLHAVNACTSRVKTLVHLPDSHALDALRPDYGAIRALCEDIDSTGIYPYALSAEGACARQFPKSSGYPEDAATGIAAAALWGYLHAQGQIPGGGIYTVRQGVAMGAPSAISLRPRDGMPGCWLSGEVRWQA
ncbi:PhzF family phenazine biosynthesis isomerase [Bordetella bronchialis]